MQTLRPETGWEYRLLTSSSVVTWSLGICLSLRKVTELSMNVGPVSTNGNNVKCGAGCDLDCELSVPEVTCCGNTLSVIVTSARPTASLPKSYYAQLYYVDSHRPWVMRKRIGSYRYIASAAQQSNASEESNLAQSVLHFGTAQLTPGAKFRVLLHTGRGGKLEVLCASNVVTICSAKGESVSASGDGLSTRGGEAATETVQCPVDGDEFDVALDSCSNEAESLFWVSDHEVRSEAYRTAISSMALNSKIWIDGLRSPPPDSFLFDLRVHKVDVELALEKYPRLMGLRFRLVPCWMEEEGSGAPAFIKWPCCVVGSKTDDIDGRHLVEMQFYLFISLYLCIPYSSTSAR